MSIRAALATAKPVTGTVALSGGKVAVASTGLRVTTAKTTATTTRTPALSGGTTGTVVVPVTATPVVELPTGGSTATPTTVATDTTTVAGATTLPEEKKIPWLHIGIGAGIIAAIVAAYFLIKKK